MAVRYAITNGNWSSTSTWNGGTTLGIPTISDDVFSNGFTVNMDVNATIISLSNTSRSRVISTPQMVSNVSPIPYTVNASTNPNGAFLAFDRNYTSSSNFWQSDSSGFPQWLSFDFVTPIVIDSYAIWGSSNQSRNPRVWTLQGSNNNTSWTDLHSVSGATAIASSSTYISPLSIGNTTFFRYYRLNIIANGGSSDVLVTELELYEQFSNTIGAGGSFNFNTAGVSVTCTSTSASLSAGATNLITVTATGGTVTMNLASIVSSSLPGSTQIFNHTGNCNFNLNGIRFIGSVNNLGYCISKTSNGLINIVGDVWGGSCNGNCHGLISSAGNTNISGNVFANVSNGAISQTSGNLTITGRINGGSSAQVRALSLGGAFSNLTITGNVFGGSTTGTEAVSIGAGTSVLINGDVYGNFANGLLSSVQAVINGSVYGGTSVAGVSTTAPLTINGNVFANGSAGLTTSSAIAITVSGDVYASSTANGISSTNASGIVNLTGNMYNSLGRNAIWCPNIFISNSTTTLWRMDVGGGLTRTLYSADSFPNLPSTSNVRNLVQYGPASALTGTMVVASPSNIRIGVLTDNTVGTANITAQDILNFINTSSDPLAVRMRTMLTDNSAGQLISKYNFV